MIDESLDILRQTSDGNQLSAGDLSLVQAAVNDCLTDHGKERFRVLHKQVVSGTYTKPFLCGIAHVTRNHQNYIFWKGIQIEHFSTHAMKEGELEACTRSFAKTCEHIEKLGLAVDCRSYFNEWLREMSPDSPESYKRLLCQLPNLYEHPDGAAAFVTCGLRSDGWPIEARFFKVANGRISTERVKLSPGCVEYHAMLASGYAVAQCGQPLQQGPTAAPLAGVMAWLQNKGISEQIAEQLVILYEQNERAVAACQTASDQIAA